MRRLALLAAAAPLALAACQTSTPETPRTPAVESDSVATLAESVTGDGLTITGLAVDHAVKGLSGRVENRATTAYDSIRVWISFLGADRDSLGSLEMTADSLAPRSAWHFTRPFTPDSVAFVRVDRYAASARGGERTDETIRAVVPAPTFMR